MPLRADWAPCWGTATCLLVYSPFPKRAPTQEAQGQAPGQPWLNCPAGCFKPPNAPARLKAIQVSGRTLSIPQGFSWYTDSLQVRTVQSII